MPTLLEGQEHETVVARMAAVLDSVARLDLSMVKRKLCESNEGPQWSRPTANEIEVEYLRYLALCSAYPEHRIVPSKLVDQFWHQHILDTRAYKNDCEAALGAFLHHYPYFGMRDAEDRAALSQAFEETLSLYHKHFGAPNHIWLSNKADCSESECFGDGPSLGGCTDRPSAY